jgi:hypothetical protein
VEYWDQFKRTEIRGVRSEGFSLSSPIPILLNVFDPDFPSTH